MYKTIYKFECLFSYVLLPTCHIVKSFRNHIFVYECFPISQSRFLILRVKRHNINHLVQIVCTMYYLNDFTYTAVLIEFQIIGVLLSDWLPHTLTRLHENNEAF